MIKRFRLWRAKQWWYPGPSIGEWSFDLVARNGRYKTWRLLPSGDYDYREPSSYEIDDYISFTAI